MKYVEYIPEEALKDYIDAYWVLQTGPVLQYARRPVFADACTEIFINLGNSRPSFNGTFTFSPGNIYLGGTMTAAGFVNSAPDSTFIGIRFKPGGFSAFYKMPLSEVVDQIVDFPDRHLLTIAEPDPQLPARLDQFFIAKKNDARSIIPITEAVHHSKGQISVDVLAKENNVSHRTLERIFNNQMGISPKEFIMVMRFQQVLKLLKSNYSGEKLLHISFDMGYYDHAHLTREVKKYSGFTPTELITGR